VYRSETETTIEAKRQHVKRSLRTGEQMSLNADKKYFEERDNRKPLEHWELVEQKANELLSIPEEISEILYRAGVLQDLGDWAKTGEMDWKVRNLIMTAARDYAEKLL
jgi:hypothetical protein